MEGGGAARTGRTAAPRAGRTRSGGPTAVARAAQTGVAKASRARVGKEAGIGRMERAGESAAGPTDRRYKHREAFVSRTPGGWSFSLVKVSPARGGGGCGPRTRPCAPNRQSSAQGPFSPALVCFWRRHKENGKDAHSLPLLTAKFSRMKFSIAETTHWACITMCLNA